MPKQSKSRDNHEVAFGVAFSNLYHLFKKANHRDRYLADSLGVRLWRGRWLAVVKAADTAASRRVVCFGAGDDIFSAISAVNSAVASGAWKDDRFDAGYAARRAKAAETREYGEG